jgi:hypothetical protein
MVQHINNKVDEGGVVRAICHAIGAIYITIEQLKEFSEGDIAEKFINDAYALFAVIDFCAVDIAGIRQVSRDGGSRRSKVVGVLRKVDRGVGSQGSGKGGEEVYGGVCRRVRDTASVQCNVVGRLEKSGVAAKNSSWIS